MNARPLSRRRLALGLAAASLAALGWRPGRAAPAAIVLATDEPETSWAGRWMRMIYVEAFRRLDLPLRVEVYPLARIGVLLDRGEVDGEFLRTAAYGAAHPALVRVDESVVDLVFALWTVDSTAAPRRLQDLADTGWQVLYRRGVLVCERALTAAIPADRLIDVTTTAQGLQMLRGARAEVYCEIDMALTNEHYAPPFKDTAMPRKLLELGDPLPTYPYLHRRHAALAAPLAAVLRQMKAEGLIERYQRDAARQLGAR